MKLVILFKSKIEIKPYKTKKPGIDTNIEITKNTASWAKKNNFDFLGFYEVQCGMRAFMAAWKLKEMPTHLCQYIIRGNRAIVIALDFETIFKNEVELTTSNTKDSIFYPKPPGWYSQSFSMYCFDELYRMHMEAEEYLITKGGTQLEKSIIDFEEFFVSYLKKEKSYQWKHWYWIFFLLYFYFVRKNKWHNKTIQQQHELGMIQLPNEMFIT